VTEKKDEETGEIIYNYTVNHYAFPTQDQIGNSIGLNSKTIRIYTKKLNDNKYNILDIWKSKTNKSNLKNDNCRYSITLFERIEYIYYHIYCTDYSHKPKELELINKYGFDKIAKSEDQRILNIQDYIKYKYQTEMEEYKKCIDDNDADRYKKVNKKLE
jgi:hypothetical protein